jgi:hypothetical protein
VTLGGFEFLSFLGTISYSLQLDTMNLLTLYSIEAHVLSYQVPSSYVAPFEYFTTPSIVIFHAL